MGLAQEVLLQREEEYTKFLKTHRFSAEALSALSSYFCWNILHEDLLVEITDQKVIDEVLSKCPEDVKRDFIRLYKFRGKFVPVLNDDDGQQEVAYYNGEYISNGAYNFDHTDMFCLISNRIDIELNAPLHRSYEEDYEDFWKKYLPSTDNE